VKTILVPTDFSEVSDNALEYAIEMAKVMHAKIVLLHAYHVPVIATDAIVIIPSMEEVKQIGIESLMKTKNRIHKQGIDIEVDYTCVEGFAVDEINLYTNTNKVDLIIMGMHGGGYITEKVIGSTTTSLLREANCPVLAIDRKVKFKIPEKIVFACDYKLAKSAVMGPLKDIAKLFSSHIYILNVIPKAEIIPSDIESSVCGLNLDHSFEPISHSFEFTTNENVVNGINQYVAVEQMDMVVMIPRKHSLLKRIFNEPNTKRMAFHTTVPVLALHEQ
jgi:nucleotide-binding universal stress UspA family protein